MKKNRTIFLNWKGPKGAETVDEFTHEEGTSRDFKKYVNEMILEYHFAGMAVYPSSRPCKAWTDK